MTPRLTPERVRELLAAATPGPWTHERIGFGGHEVTMDARGGVFVDRDREHDAALIAAAPDLAADVLALHDAFARVTRERDAAVAACDALVTAVRAECASVADAAYAEAKRRNDVMGDRRDWDGCTESGAAMDAAAGIARRIRSTTGAPADVVRADVVREYLAAEDAWQASDDAQAATATCDAARAALDAALAAAGGR